MSGASALSAVEYADPGVRWPQRTYYGLTGVAWMRIAVIALLMAAVFWPNLRRLWLKTNPFTGEPNWGHSIFIPLIGLYYLYLNREALLKAPVKTAWTGLAIMFGGLLLFAYGIYPGQNDFIKDFAMVVTLFGVVALLCGWSVMKIAWFPIAFLVCGIPWPGLVYSWIAMPLQELAASAAVGTLRMAGVEALRTGTKLIIGAGETQRVLNVAEACAGLKALMTFITVGAAVAFLSSRKLWEKLVITFSAIPIAVFCNMMRVSGQGLLDRVNPQLSESFAHQFVGMFMLIPGFGLILLVGWILDQLFIEEADRRKLAAGASTGGESLVIEVPRHPRPAPSSAPRPAASSAATGPEGEAQDLAEATRRLMAASGPRGRKPRESSSDATASGASMPERREE